MVSSIIYARKHEKWCHISWLFLFAITMAYMEATIVIYLRELYYPDNLLALFPLKLMTSTHFAIELGRESAAMLMIISVAMLVERGFTRCFAVYCYVMGVWDLFYYIWLKLLIDWPTAWLEWDVLFLIPWIWLGPWICPAVIALLFVGWGLFVIRRDSTDSPIQFSRWNGVLFVLGATCGLASFLQPALPYLNNPVLLEGYMPGQFNWSLYVAGTLLMAGGLPWKKRGSVSIRCGYRDGRS